MHEHVQCVISSQLVNPSDVNRLEISTVIKAQSENEGTLT